MTYIVAEDARDFIPTLTDESVDLALFDPPYFDIVKEAWDNAWKTETEFVEYVSGICKLAFPKLKPTGSLIVFGGLGKHGVHPFFDVVKKIEEKFIFQDWITWKKRRAYGKQKGYLYCREEIAWFSKTKDYAFNIPYLAEKRGYPGFNKKYPAKSEYKRVSNVWDDIPELMRPKRPTQKPLPLLNRLIETHSNVGDLVIDVFSGYGSTGLSALPLNRKFMGCELITKDAALAEERMQELKKALDKPKPKA
jgi:site-specific DNA-methyltransferase (adenine-specific)